MLDAVCGAEAGDPFIIMKPTRPYVAELQAPFKKLRIAFTTEAWAPYPVAAEIKDAVEKAAAACLEMGHAVEADGPRLDFEKVNTVLMNIFGLSDVGLAKFAESIGRKLSLDYLEPGTLNAF